MQRNSLIFHSVFLTFAYYKKVGQQKEKSLVILLLLTSLCMVTNSLPRMGRGAHWTPSVLGSGIRKSSDSTNLCYVSFGSFLYGQIAPKWNLGPVLAFRLYRCAQQLRNMLFSKFIMELVSKILLMSVLAKMCHF